MFLDEFDHNCAHALKHAQAASRSASKLLDEMNRLYERMHWDEMYPNRELKVTTQEIRPAVQRA